MNQKNDKFEEGTKNNIVLVKYKPKAKLITCKCPNCEAIFSMEFSNNRKFKSYGCWVDDCPVCGVCYNWLSFRIPIFWYKWLRYIRRNKNE